MFSILVSNKSNYMAFIRFETEITSERKIVQSYTGDSPFPSWKQKMKFVPNSPIALLFHLQAFTARPPQAARFSKSEFQERF